MKERLRGDPRSAAELGYAEAFRIDQFSVLDHADGKAGQTTLLDFFLDLRLQFGGESCDRISFCGVGSLSSCEDGEQAKQETGGGGARQGSGDHSFRVPYASATSKRRVSFEIDPNSLVDFDVTEGRSVSEWQKEKDETCYDGSFAQKVDLIWNEPVSTGSAGALARPSVRSTVDLKPLDAVTVSRFALI